jgi:hypothetical protein
MHRVRLFLDEPIKSVLALIPRGKVERGVPKLVAAVQNRRLCNRFDDAQDDSRMPEMKNVVGQQFKAASFLGKFQKQSRPLVVTQYALHKSETMPGQHRISVSGKECLVPPFWDWTGPAFLSVPLQFVWGSDMSDA